jgi:hypothetical protein
LIRRRFRIFQYGPQYLGGSDAAALARQFIAAARAAQPFENIGANQRLKKRFEMPGRQSQPPGEGFGRDRVRPRVDCDIGHSGERQ